MKGKIFKLLKGVIIKEMEDLRLRGIKTEEDRDVAKSLIIASWKLGLLKK